MNQASQQNDLSSSNDNVTTAFGELNHVASVSGNNGNNDVSRNSTDALARGLSTILTTVITDFESKAKDTLKSQDQLSCALDRLTGELDQLLEDAPLPFIMQHAAKISAVRKRVSSLNSVLKTIQQRVDNIDRMLSVSTTHEKTAVESS